MTAKTRKLKNRPAALDERWMVFGICLLLGAIVWGAFGQTLGFEFVNYDDDSYVSGNVAVCRGLTLGGIAQAFTHKESGLWNPLVTISHMIDCQLFGLEAGRHHLTNVVLHLASAILLFLILRRMTAALWRSAFVAAVFAVHPLKVESVAWISERKDVLSGLFFMLTLGAYLGYVRRPDSGVRYLSVIILFAMGLMCKPMLVTVPLVLLLLDYWPLQRLFAGSPAPGGKGATGAFFRGRVVVEKLPLLALSIGIGVVTLLGGKDAGAAGIEPISFWARMGEVPVWLVVYLGQMIWPAGLAVVYTHHERSLPWWPAAVAIYGLMTLIFYRLRGRRPYLWTGWMWNLVMLAPVSGVLQISRHARADHYTYLPQIGLSLMVTWAVADLCAGLPWRRWMPGLLSAGVIGTLVMVTRRQVSCWRDSESLWNHTLACTQDNHIAHFNLGETFLQKGRLDEALAQYEKALEIKPSYAEAHVNLGVALQKTGRLAEALGHYQEALESNPGYAEAHNNLGLALEQTGRLDEALSHYQKAIELKPSFAEAYYNKGNLLRQGGRLEEAVAQYQMALELVPEYAEAHGNLGFALQQKGQMDEALAHYRKAIEINPDDAQSLNNLSYVLAASDKASLRNGAEAVELAQRVVRLSGGSNPTVLGTLAAAQAETGDFPGAVATVQGAIRLAESQGMPGLAALLQKHLILYEAGKPLRMGP